MACWGPNGPNMPLGHVNELVQEKVKVMPKPNSNEELWITPQTTHRIADPILRPPGGAPINTSPHLSQTYLFPLPHPHNLRKAPPVTLHG